MQLYPIVLIAVLLLADGGLGFAADGPRLGPGPASGVAFGVVLFVLGLPTAAGARPRGDPLAGRTPAASIEVVTFTEETPWADCESVPPRW